MLLMKQTWVVVPQERLRLRLLPVADGVARDACTELLGEHELTPDVLVVHVELGCESRQAACVGRILCLDVRVIVQNLREWGGDKFHQMSS